MRIVFERRRIQTEAHQSDHLEVNSCTKTCLHLRSNDILCETPDSKPYIITYLNVLFSKQGSFIMYVYIVAA